MTEPRSPRYDFIGQRRLLPSDLAWYGLGLVVAGIAALTKFDGWTRWLGAPALVAGLALVGLAVRRRLRADRMPRQPWPELPAESVAVTLPPLGQGVASAIILRVNKTVGERVALNDPIAEVSTDKVDTEVAATAAGLVTGVLVHPGQEVPIGFPILAIGPDWDGAS